MADNSELMTDLLPTPESVKRSKAHTRHGHTSGLNGASRSTPTYTTWQAMRVRCRLVYRDVDEKYAGRGISYDPAWDSFDQFLIDMGERPHGTTLDRIDNDGP